ncbi:AMP-binding enzyme [Streptomyces mirabilis]
MSATPGPRRTASRSSVRRSGRPDLTDRVLAVVQPAAADVIADELLAYWRERLAPYKCPRAVDFVLSLPRDPSGTLRKGLLQETYWRNHETRIV